MHGAAHIAALIVREGRIEDDVLLRSPVNFLRWWGGFSSVPLSLSELQLRRQPFISSSISSGCLGDLAVSTWGG